MTDKRFKRYLLDGGFWFEEYVEPVWAITDRLDKNSPITHIEFKDEYKDLCDEVVKLLNELHEENKQLKEAIAETEKIVQSTYDELTKLRCFKKNILRIKHSWDYLMEAIQYD